MRYVAVGAIAILWLVSIAGVRAGKADDARRFADANAKVRRAELEKAVEANRKVPGTTPDTEIQRLRLAYVLAALGPDADPAAKMAAQALVAIFAAGSASGPSRSEEHTSELQSQSNLVCRLLLE